MSYSEIDITCTKKQKKSEPKQAEILQTFEHHDSQSTQRNNKELNASLQLGGQAVSSTQSKLGAQVAAQGSKNSEDDDGGVNVEDKQLLLVKFI